MELVVRKRREHTTVVCSYHRNIQERQFLPMFWFNWAGVTFTEGAFKYMNLMEVKTSRQCEKNWIPASSANYSRKIYSWQSQFCNSCLHRHKFKKVCWRILCGGRAGRNFWQVTNMCTKNEGTCILKYLVSPLSRHKMIIFMWEVWIAL